MTHIRRAVEAALRQPPVSTDAAMTALRDGVVGRPLLASTPEGAPAFWLVPLECDDRACGFARVGLSGQVEQVGRFGGGTEDKSVWPDADFFRSPPAQVLRQLRAKHPGAPLSEPAFSYDGNPAKWAWRIAIGGCVNSIAYVTPAGWYERPASPPRQQGLEG